MRTNEKNKESVKLSDLASSSPSAGTSSSTTSATSVLSSTASSAVSSSASSQYEKFIDQDFKTVLSQKVAYDEMSDVPVQQVDPVAMVEKNMAHLFELQSRMKFMMKEIRYIMKV